MPFIFISTTYVDESMTVPWEGNDYTNGRISSFNDIAQRLCEKYGAEFVDVKGMDNSMLSDGLHPNNKGYEHMFKIILPKVKEIFPEIIS